MNLFTHKNRWKYAQSGVICSPFKHVNSDVNAFCHCPFFIVYSEKWCDSVLRALISFNIHFLTLCNGVPTQRVICSAPTRDQYHELTCPIVYFVERLFLSYQLMISPISFPNTLQLCVDSVRYLQHIHDESNHGVLCTVPALSIPCSVKWLITSFQAISSVDKAFMTYCICIYGSTQHVVYSSFTRVNHHDTLIWCTHVLRRKITCVALSSLGTSK